MKKFNLLKMALVTSGLVTTLSACGTKYVEGKQVKGTCVYNGYHETIDFSKTIELKDEKLGTLKLTGDKKNNFFSIGDFKSYDSLYLADVNGDGYNDLCTDYVYKNLSGQKIHAYAFYNYKKKEYIEQNYPTKPFSRYLDVNNGVLVVKEFHYEHDITVLYSEKYLRRTGFFVTGKQGPTIHWTNLPFKITAMSYMLEYSTETEGGASGGSSWRDEDGGVKRYFATTNKTYSLILFYNYDGYVDEETNLNILKFKGSNIYDITFEPIGGWGFEENTPYVIFVCYRVNFKAEGKFSIDFEYLNMVFPLYVYIDNSEQYPM